MSGSCLGVDAGQVGAPRRSRLGRRAFTLVELLVVLFIITLLVMILTPFLAGAKESAYSTLCQNNLEKLSTALRTAAPGKAYAKLPDPYGWIAAATGGGGGPVLRCPKGYYTGTAGTLACQPNVEYREEPPMSCVFDAPVPDIEHNTTIWAWTERVNYVLPRDVVVDIGKPGFYEKDHARNSKTIPAGTMVNCYFLHFDAVAKGPATTQGVVTVGSEILGVICLSKSQDAVDDALGFPGTTYHTGRQSRGFENSGQDAVTLEEDLRTLTINQFHVTSPGEDVRILVRPEGEASYGMNNQIDGTVPKMDQLLLLEYNRMVADVDGEGRDDDLEVELAPRHFGRVNTLLVNGSVKLRWPDEVDPNKPIWRR